MFVDSIGIFDCHLPAEEKKKATIDVNSGEIINAFFFSLLAYTSSTNNGVCGKWTFSFFSIFIVLLSLALLRSVFSVHFLLLIRRSL